MRAMIDLVRYFYLSNFARVECILIKFEFAIFILFFLFIAKKEREKNKKNTLLFKQIKEL